MGNLESMEIIQKTKPISDSYKEDLPKITLIIIAHKKTNELLRLIDQLHTLIKCDTKEHSIIDSGIFADTSPDGICKSIKTNPGIKYLHLPTNPDTIHFAQLRNYLINQCQTDWFLFLDSDELLSKKAVSWLANWAVQSNTVAYSFPRIDIFHSKEMKYGETRGFKAIRFGKKGYVTYSRRVHEVAVVTDGKIEFVNAPILHFAHPSIHSFISSITHYSKLDAQSKKWSILILFQMLTFPIVKFLYTYIFKRGFLDGYAGLTYSTIMSLHSFLVRSHTYEIHRTKR